MNQVLSTPNQKLVFQIDDFWWIHKFRHGKLNGELFYPLSDSCIFGSFKSKDIFLQYVIYAFFGGNLRSMNLFYGLVDFLTRKSEANLTLRWVLSIIGKLRKTLVPGIVKTRDRKLSFRYSRKIKTILIKILRWLNHIVNSWTHILIQ